MKRSYLAALLGVAIGVLATLAFQKFSGRSGLMDVGRNWHKVELILGSIDENYVDSVDHKKVTDAIAAAALSALDPHSVYMLPRTLEASEEDLAGNFDGIGIQFNVPNDTAVVIEVIPGGPSEKIGLQPGDRLIKVDTTVIAGVQFPQDSMVRRIKGRAGSKVTVTVQRGDETIPFEITRGKIPTHSVDAAFMVDDTTGYIRLSKFSRTTAQEFMISGTELLAKGMKRLILDLRNNSGGFLDQALMLSNMFLHEDDPIVYMEGLHRKREDFKADGSGIDLSVKSIITGDGYPIDIAVSPDGTELITSYVSIENSQTIPKVIFRNFDEVGQAADARRVVGGFTDEFAGHLVGKVNFSSNEYSQAFYDGGIAFFSTKVLTSPELLANVTFEEEINSIAYSKDYAAVVLNTNTGEMPYKLVVFKANGTKLSETEFNFPYTSFEINGDYILLYNETACRVYNTRGHELLAADLPAQTSFMVKTGFMGEFLIGGSGQMMKVKMN